MSQLPLNSRAAFISSTFLCALVMGAPQVAWAKSEIEVIGLPDWLMEEPRVAGDQIDGSTNNLSSSNKGLSLLRAGSKASKEGDFLEALRFLKEARTVFARERGEDHPDTLVSMSILAVTYGDLGQHDKALALNEEVLRLRRAKLGEDHSDTLSSMSNLATIYSDLGQYDKAMALQEQTLKLRRAKLGEDHPDTLDSMDALGWAYKLLNESDNAISLREHKLKVSRARFGETHWSTANAVSSLGNAYIAVKQYDKAVVLWKQSLTLMDNAYAKCVGMERLAESYGRIGQIEKVESLSIELSNICKHYHRSKRSIMANLASTYRNLGLRDKFVAQTEDIVKFLGEDHADALGLIKSLVGTYSSIGQHEKEREITARMFSLTNRRIRLNAKFYSRFDKTEELQKKNLVLMREQLGKEHPGTLSLMNDLALTYSATGRPHDAEALCKETLVLRKKILGETHQDTLSSMVFLADTYRTLSGDFRNEIELRKQILQLNLAKHGEDHPKSLKSMNELALTYSHFTLFDMALPLNEQLFKIWYVKEGENRSETIYSMNKLADTYSSLGRYDNALVLHEKHLGWALKDDEPNKRYFYSHDPMANLATTYIALGQHDKALALTEEILRLNPDSRIPSLPVIYFALGRYDKALELNEKFFKFFRSEVGASSEKTLGSMNNLAANHRALGQYDKALALNEEVFRLRRAKLGENHPYTIEAMHNQAINYLPLDRPAQAFAHVPDIFIAVEKLRSAPGYTIEQRQSIFATWSDNYQNYANWYASAERFSEGFNIGDLSKARTLTESIKAQAALRSLPVAEQQKLQASEARAQQLQTQIDKLNAQNTRDSSAVLALQKQLDTHNSSHLQLVAELNSRYPKYAQLTNLKPATAAQGKQLLAQGDLFISYLIHTKGDAQAFILDASGEPRWVDLGKINNHAQTVAASRELIAPGTRDSGQGRLVALKDGGYQWLQPGQANPKDATAAASNPNDARQQLNRYWHDKLIKPIQSLAGNSPRWIISPDKDLALLPFDTLPETISATGEPGKTLAQTRNLTLVQSFAVYALLKQRENDYAQLQRPKELFAMGNAIYSDGWAENRGLSRGSGERRYTQRNAKLIASESDITSNPISNGNSTPLKPAAEQFNIDQLEWKNLPGTAREVKAVSAVFNTNASTSSKGSGSSGGADSYLGKDASEGKLQQLNESGKLKDYRYLLFSAHGYLAQTPALSSLVLSLQGNPPGIDGYVTASEWPLYDVKSDLTVLSACDTGVGKTQAGESVMGLPYALFVAGNKNTLLSLWPVDDDATAEFMKRFFTKLKAGSKQPDALTETKREFMLHPTWSAPRYWAAFVLYGV